ncbi:DUF4861 domain-containing protein [Adhaeribacter aquaticus]|uniref:DUF4861 domain-containing protein n=1 Tax=Adhaeribacter aquaticus TaxID=299567 RepID=UPI0003FFC756|nr:DUF4861 domain-containing protein [Adhaeribacter aquaticus]
MKYFTKKRAFKAGSSLLLAFCLSSFQYAGLSRTIAVKNKLNLDRQAETISIPVSVVKGLVAKFEADNLFIKNAATNKILVSQTIDNNLDGVMDEIIFQTSIKANQEQRFIISGAPNGASQRPKSELTTYSRFVPERTDDYTWENDRVAFRTYGPVAQQLTESGKPGGTLTSGMDAWLKRVSYPIINKWYRNNQEQNGAYHKDTGEGYDPYHVGLSRGIGGIGVWENDSLYVSKNFTGYKTIAVGPIRTVFELSYAPWSANGRTIQEKKRISLDLGSNLTRFEEELISSKPLPNCTIGITLHDQKGEVKVDSKSGWFRYWEPMDDSYLGTAIVINPALVKSFKDHRSKAKEQSHLLVMSNVKNKKVVYYAGFAWVKSAQFKTKEEWDQYLANFAKRIVSPLEIKII